MPKDTSIKSILVIGSGPIIIGQAAEFDYAGTQACIALKEEGYRVILLNNNPATVMTDPVFADAVYFEPMTVESVEKIIIKEQPDGLLATLGGQAGLNLAFQLSEQGIINKYGLKVLGTSIASIKQGEDRDAFRSLMHELNEPVPESEVVHSVAEAVKFADETGFPLIVRPAYTLGGTGGGIADSKEELVTLVSGGLNESPIHQCLIEKSIAGFKEVEYEMMRDCNGTCIAICNMENFDPVGIHTGDSIVVAPSQTLTDREYQMLRSAAVKIISALGIVGGCNIQFALDPESKNYYLIEVNPRVSRSSALASKATGYPIARMAAKLAVGYLLSELKNPVTGNTYASYEPALDYVVVKIPKWPFDKFPGIERRLGTQMKATGEAMGIDRNFERALLKAVRSLDMNVSDLNLARLKEKTIEQLDEILSDQSDERLFVIMELLRKGVKKEVIHQKTKVDLFFLSKLEGLVQLEKEIASLAASDITAQKLSFFKEKGFSDEYLGKAWGMSESGLRSLRSKLGVKPSYKMVDTCAAEFESGSNYFYSAYFGENEAPKTEKRKILILGSGPIRIGQGIEFDYCSVHGVLALKEENIETIMINNNPETVSTDFALSDRLYFEPLCLEEILNVVEAEGIEEAIVQLGGQTALNLASALEEHGIKLLGTSSDMIDTFEDRDKFYELLDRLQIPRVKGVTACEEQELIKAVQTIGYPVLIRPSYVIGGQDMVVIHEDHVLKSYLEGQIIQYPVLVDQFLPANEAEIDLAADGEYIMVPAIMEHIEKTGVHSGDSLSMIPAQTLSEEVKGKIVDYASRIVKETGYKGLMNIQYIIEGNNVYILEVNPRSSRTMPIVSKVTGTPLVNKATKILLGKYKMSKNELPVLDNEKSDYVCLKYPVFSNFALRGLDLKTGPQMMSTGEGISVGATIEEALKKYFYSLAPKKGTRVLFSSSTSLDVQLINEAALSNIDLVHFDGSFPEPEKIAGVFCNGIGQDDVALRQWAIRQRKLVFSNEETIKAFLRGNRAEEWNVKPMGEWLTQIKKGVSVK
ncbi:carbamoyl phosphate synthase large subunit [Mesobacillus foraminis]|uniref:carbamoyl phosphate synthase large subunit n=1 Tax=Mesobacillus foraminis TaxID=279826 RepID=UPI001BE521E1|nr:carbamoyl phosphate synthase large subunit [Mesobacillus foraminis]MBT2756403.1 carbamoyl phosphate synthase large subunit [Mesobacillus foraminis]